MLCRMAGGIDDIADMMYDTEGAPLGTFSARIRAARGFGIIGPLAESHMDSIRLIRNQFAHSPLRLDFTNEAIAAEIDKLFPDENKTYRPDWSPQRRRYVGTCTMLIGAFDERMREHLNNRVEVWTH